MHWYKHTSRLQYFKYDYTDKVYFLRRTDEHGPFRREREIMLHVELVGIIW
mgnify:CR=1 FL=1